MFNSNCGSVLHHFDFEKYYHLEIRVNGHSRSSKLVQSDSLSTVSY